MRILIVEDEAPMVMILRRFLLPLASHIDTTDDLQAGVELARVGKYNVVLQDLKLRKTGKEEGLAAIREFKKYNAAVVVVSGIPDVKDEVMQAGADAFIPKDGGFTERAVLMATNVATLKLPEGAYKSDSYKSHVDMLQEMCEQQ